MALPAKKLSGTDDESFSYIERLVDTRLRIADDADASSGDRTRLVQELYEGPKQCACCINWVDEPPANVSVAVSEPENPYPLTVRRTLLPGSDTTLTKLHSIQVHDAEVRRILIEQVFEGYDHVTVRLKHLVLYAPFVQ